MDKQALLEIRKKSFEERVTKEKANEERDAVIRARFHQWLLDNGFKQYETPKLGHSYSGSHIETLWQAYLHATLVERNSINL